jgi:hypothetical protein
MPGPQVMLEYAFAEPRRAGDASFSVARFFAFGYVVACVLALILMGTVMALQV